MCSSSPKNFQDFLVRFCLLRNHYFVVSILAKNVNVSAKPALEITFLSVDDIMFTIFRQFRLLFFQSLHQNQHQAQLNSMLNLVPAAKSGKYFVLFFSSIQWDRKRTNSIMLCSISSCQWTSCQKCNHKQSLLKRNQTKSYNFQELVIPKNPISPICFIHSSSESVVFFSKSFFVLNYYFVNKILLQSHEAFLFLRKIFHREDIL